MRPHGKPQICEVGLRAPDWLSWSAPRLAAGRQSAPDVQGDMAAPALGGFAPTPEFPEIEEALFADVVLTRRAFHDGAPHCLRYP